MPIHQLPGQARQTPIRPAILVSLCDSSGHWSGPEAPPKILGNVHWEALEDGLWQATLAALQEQTISYGALETCLHKLVRLALAHGAGVHMECPGDWGRARPLLEKMLTNPGVEVYLYEEGRNIC